MRMGQKWQREPEVPEHPPVKRTHSRAIDVSTSAMFWIVSCSLVDVETTWNL